MQHIVQGPWGFRAAKCFVGWELLPMFGYQEIWEKMLEQKEKRKIKKKWKN